MNATIEKFGYPATLVAEYRHWLVLLRPAQPTLGSLVLAARGDAEAFSDLPGPAFAEMHAVIGDIEAVLREAVDYARINYMMLMMVDPHVHFHVIPRYNGARAAAGLSVEDRGWPKLPALNEAVELDARQTEGLAEWLRSRWPRAR
jgi:diadenosine tetraphosphate (Ap4A) HIT family hydrolase